MSNYFVILVWCYATLTISHVIEKSDGYIFQTTMFIAFSILMCMLIKKIRNVENYDFVYPQKNIAIILIFAILAYGIIYGYPALSGDWYSEQELNEDIYKKAYKGVLLWAPMMLWLSNQKYKKTCILSLLFSFLVVNRTFPIIYAIVLMGKIEGPIKKISIAVGSLLLILSMTALKSDNLDITSGITTLYERVNVVEFEGLDVLLTNAHDISDGISDEINRYFLRDGSLLITQKVAALQRGLETDKYTTDLGAPTVNAYGDFWYITKNYTESTFLFLTFLYVFARYITKNIRSPGVNLIAWLILIYWIRNGVLLPVIIGILIDMAPGYFLIRKLRVVK